jgi:hypothetical protein
VLETGSKNHTNQKSVRQLVRERVQRFLEEQKKETSEHRRSVSFSSYKEENLSSNKTGLTRNLNILQKLGLAKF